MIVKTNVKINLGLSVLRKRADGYHDIETVFVPCFDFGDTLEIITGDDYSHTSAALFAKYGEEQISQGISEDGKLMITIAREDGVDWQPTKDLCAQAYSILAADFKLPPVKIFLEKTAPVGAGLGGGSADAAFTLKALNELCGLGLSDSKLSEYASRLGSDCPFFIFNRPMFGSGRGEILQPIELDLEDYELKVLVPDGISVSTAEAYGGIIPREGGQPEDSGRQKAGLPDDAGQVSLREAISKPVADWKGLLVNDFEATVFARHPELGAIRQSLYESGAVYASMSGSGSALFALYRKQSTSDSSAAAGRL